MLFDADLRFAAIVAPEIPEWGEEGEPGANLPSLLIEWRDEAACALSRRDHRVLPLFRDICVSLVVDIFACAPASVA
jgi:hypothetical protein